MKSAPFFESCFGKIAVSKRLAYLFQSRVLAVLRMPFQRLANGVVNTKTEMSRLSMLSKRIARVDKKLRNGLIEFLQEQFSATSVALLRKEAQKIPFFPLKLLKGRVFTPDAKYRPKTFGCLFYEYKAILSLLREGRQLVCFKCIEGEKLFFQPNEKGVFVLVTEFKPLQTVVVFEGVAKVDKDTLAKTITKIGFSEVILMCGAIEPPYERTSTLEDVPNEEARLEIEAYRKKAEKLDKILLLDHVYAATVKEEMKR